MNICDYGGFQNVKEGMQNVPEGGGVLCGYGYNISIKVWTK
jgi:hypothetical protein